MQKYQLSPSEQNQLRETHISNCGAICIVLILVGIAYFVFLKYSFSPYLWIAHPIVFLIYPFFIYNIWNVWMDYKSGYKRIMTGEVINKKIKYVSQSSGMSTTGGTYAGGHLYSSSSSMSSGSRTIYKIKVDSVWYNVPVNVYERHKIGSHVHWYLTYQTKSFLSEVRD